MKKELQAIAITILGFAVLLAVFSPAYAWSCDKYNFRVTSEGKVQVENQSDSDEPGQGADVYINGSKVIDNAAAPAMPKHTDWKSFASVEVPSGDWTWKVKGEKDCSDSGEHHGPGPTDTPRPATATPTAFPTFTATVQPTETPGPPATDTPQPAPSETPAPTATATNVPPTAPPPTDKPPKPTDRPQPTATLVPNATPTANATATATALPTGTRAPEGSTEGTVVCGICCCCCPTTEGPIINELEFDEDAEQLLLSISATQAAELNHIAGHLHELAWAVRAGVILVGSELLIYGYSVLRKRQS